MTANLTEWRLMESRKKFIGVALLSAAQLRQKFPERNLEIPYPTTLYPTLCSILNLSAIIAINSLFVGLVLDALTV